MRIIGPVTAIVIATLVCFASEAHAQKNPVKLIQQWPGSIEDEALLKGTPEFITTAAGFEKLWQKWKLPGKAPTVDFNRELVLIATTSGSKLQLMPRLDEAGNLEPLAIATRDLRPGFRFVIGAVSREGVKTVAGKKLPKE